MFQHKMELDYFYYNGIFKLDIAELLVFNYFHTCIVAIMVVLMIKCVAHEAFLVYTGNSAIENYKTSKEE